MKGASPTAIADTEPAPLHCASGNSNVMAGIEPKRTSIVSLKVQKSPSTVNQNSPLSETTIDSVCSPLFTSLDFFALTDAGFVVSVLSSFVILILQLLYIYFEIKG